MIIDFHTHVFPDKIAHKTIAMLSEKANIPAYTDGTVDGLLQRMNEAGVSLAVKAIELICRAFSGRRRKAPDPDGIEAEFVDKSHEL